MKHGTDFANEKSTRLILEETLKISMRKNLHFPFINTSKDTLSVRCDDLFSLFWKNFVTIQVLEIAYSKFLESFIMTKGTLYQTFFFCIVLLYFHYHFSLPHYHRIPTKYRVGLQHQSMNTYLIPWHTRWEGCWWGGSTRRRFMCLCTHYTRAMEEEVRVTVWLNHSPWLYDQ